MTTAADLEALAQRAESEEPSRELDDAIATAINAPRGWIGATALCRDYTSSLDAAALLVPPGWEVADLYQFRRAHESQLRWRCGLYRDLETDVTGTADTEPRARTAAALRAMAMELK